MSDSLEKGKKSKLAQMSQDNLMKAVFILAWPVIIEMLLNSTVGIADTAMVGRLQNASVAIAAIGLSNQLVMFSTTLFAAIRTGATVLVARLAGAGDLEGAKKAAGQALLIGSIVGVVFASFFLFFPRVGVRFMGAEPEVVEMAVSYLRFRAVAMIFGIITMTITSILRGLGDTKIAMYVNVTVSLLNVGLNYLFIFGPSVFPEMGTAGAGFASMLARMVGATIMLWVITSGRSIIKIDLKKIGGFHKETIMRMLRVGIPAGVESIMLRGAMMGFTMIVANLGTEMYAAHQVALRVDSVAFMPGFGFAIAATTLVGQNLGAKQPDIARRAGNITMILSGVFMGAVALAIFIFAERFVWFFTDVPEVIAAGSQVLRIMAFTLPFMGIARVAAGGLRGAGDTSFVMWGTGISIWLTRIMLAYVLVNFFNLGLPGAWIGMAFDNLLRAVLFFVRWTKGRWQEIEV